MKININYPVTYLIVFILIMCGCEKNYLVQTPYDSLSTNQALGTPSALQTALNGAYANLRSVSLYGRDLPVIGDLQADNTFVALKNSGRYLSQYNYSFISTDDVVTEIWQTAYIGILDVNQIIDADVSGTGVDVIKAQAYAIRALLYFKLVNLYARPYTDDPSGLGVPLILHYAPYLRPARNTVTEVYTQIISDFKAAMQNAPEYSTSVTLSKYSIEALLARAYFYEADYTNAKAAAVDVISNSGFSLVSAGNYDAFWQNPAIQSDATEVMFEVDADAINNNGFDDLAGIYVNGYDDIYCSIQLYNLYSNTDVRKSVLYEGTTNSGASAIVVNKFPNAQNSDKDNLKVIRLAEVYLIAAESSLPANEADAKKYLNDLLAQRDPDFTGYTSTGTQLLDDIVTERRKELAFEGDRLLDMNRLKLDIARSPNTGALPAGPGNINLNIPYSDYRRIYPIPENEISANPNIVQNPGY